jgi:hypothetical protein
VRAWSLVRRLPVYRAEAFETGLKAAGFDVIVGNPTIPSPGDVLLLWNRYAGWHETATAFEAYGGKVIVAENGYIGPRGLSPHSQNPREWFALAIGGHNGSGKWNVGGPERWQALGVALEPWRVTGEQIVICPNRPFGRPGTAMPPTWAQDVSERLRKLSDRPIRIRPHPGNEAPKTPLERDLEGAYACVIWGSSAGVQALVRGIPVVCEAPYWICKRITFEPWALNEIDKPNNRSLLEEDRLETLEIMAWAQWHISEIQSGAAFEHLLSLPARQSQIEKCC